MQVSVTVPKIGLDDYLVSHSPEAFREEVIDRALIWTPRGNIRVENASEFVNRSLPHQDSIIGSGVLPAFGTAFISSYSKMGKSIYATNMGIAIAAGKPFLNQFDVPRPRQVLYLQEEIGERSMQDRLRKQLTYAKSLGIDPGNNFELVNKSGIRLMTDEGLKTVTRLFRARRPEVVIWDCLYRFQSLNENKAEEMQQVCDRFEYLGRTFQIAQVIVHHHGQPAENDSRQGFQLMRGSSVLTAFADSYFTLTRYRKEGDPRYQKLNFELRNAESPEDLIVFRNPDLWYEVVKEADRVKGKVTMTSVVSTLMQMGGSAGRQEFIQGVMDTYQVSDRTAVKAIEEACDLNRIERKKTGKTVCFSIHGMNETMSESEK